MASNGDLIRRGDVFDQIQYGLGLSLGEITRRVADLPAVTPAAPTVAEAARVLLSDRAIITELAIKIMRNNRLIDGKRIGYQPALEAALRAIEGDKT